MVNLDYDIEGPSDADALVLLNSVGTTRGMWDPVSDALLEHFRVVRLDIRGHGESDRAGADDSCTLADLANDVLHVLDSAGLESAHVAGMTLGGMTAIWLAANHPERVKRLALIGTSAHPNRPGPTLERAAKVRAGGMEVVADAVVARWITPEHAERDPQLLTRLRAMVTSTDAETYAQCCEVLSTLDVRGDLPNIQADTLIIAGDQDPVSPMQPHGAALGAAIPNSRLLEVKTSAHIPVLEVPEVIGPALVDHFLRRGPDPGHRLMPAPEVSARPSAGKG
jgi:3-oxoadipate enol-lactonase